MIQIINEYNLVLELDSSSSIPVERKLPLLSDSDNFLQDVTYSSKAGLTDNNKLFIQSGHLVDAKLKVYEFPVRVVVMGEPFFAGIFSYKMESEKISFMLKINFGAVATKLEKTLIREILTEDINRSAGTNAAWETLMKDTCVNPQNYPYAFFPVYNERWYNETDQPNYPWMNAWDHAAQKFVVNVSGSGGFITSTLQVPFFKLSYLLKQLFNYLGFSLQGELLQDTDFNSIYVYTRRGIKARAINGCFSYLPDKLTGKKFLKDIGERLNVNFRWDVLNKQVTMESLVTELLKTSYIDLTEYVENISELSANEKSGYTVTLKPDTTDEASNMAIPEATEKVFLPAFSLIVGDGENKVELDVSTLASKQMVGYVVPEAKQTIFVNQPDLQEWPIRLMKFTGMKSLGGLVVAPEALPYELSAENATFYRFLSDSKKAIINANVPSGLLAKLKTMGKIAFKSKEGTFMYALPPAQSFAFTNSYPDYIPVQIEAQVILSSSQTPFTILPADKPEDTTNGKSIMKFKFAISEGSYGPDQVTMYREPIGSSAATFKHYPAKSAADIFGVGGHVGQSFATGGSRTDIYNSKIKIYDQMPKYILAGGQRITWNVVGDHFEPAISPTLWIDDGRPLLIVF
jgi:hypothetical protein